MASFELGPNGVVQGTTTDTSGVIGTTLEIPYSAWPGWSNGTARCRIEGYIEHFPWPEGASPAYVVQTMDDGWLYEFRPWKCERAGRRRHMSARDKACTRCGRVSALDTAWTRESTRQDCMCIA